MRKIIKSLFVTTICMIFVFSMSIGNNVKAQEVIPQEDTGENGSDNQLDNSINNEQSEAQEESQVSQEETTSIEKGNTIDKEEVKDSILPSDHVFTTMDENGNIVVLDMSGLEEVTKKEQASKSNKQAFKATANPTNGIVNFKTKSSSLYNTNYVEDGTNRSGYLNGYYGADGAFLGYNADKSKVKFMQSGVIGWVSADEVDVLNYDSASVKSVNFYRVEYGRIYHYGTNNISSNYYFMKTDVGPKQSYMGDNVAYYSYDGHYFYTSFSKMISDYKSGTRNNSINVNSPYYNYYQYLSHRTKTNINPDRLDSYVLTKASGSSKMSGIGDSMVSNQNTYGVNALLMFGVAANESAWGMSSIAQTKNNLFGHAAYDSDPNASNGYSSAAFSVYYHAKVFISEGYLDAKDSRYFGAHLGDKASGVNVKYASDPYWGEKAAAVAWDVSNANTSANDSKAYTLGIKTNAVDINIRKESSSSSKVFYTSKPTRDYPFVILGSVSGESVAGNSNWYKIQSDSTLYADRSGIVINYGYYNYSTFYAYAHSSNVRIVANASPRVNSAPVISNVSVINKSNDKYTVRFMAKDDVYVELTNIVVWTKNDKSDLKWLKPVKVAKDTYEYTVNMKDFNNVNGTYYATLYAYDKDGGRGEASVPSNALTSKNTPPIINNVKISKLDSTGYTITFDAQDPDGYLVAADVVAYNEIRGEKSLVWRHASKIGTKTYQYRVDIKDHGNQKGNYISKIYVYDASGARSEYAIEKQNVGNVVNKAPEISNIKVSDVSLSGYTVTFDASDSDGSVAVADVTAYNENRGVGTLVWRHASKIGTKTYQYRVNTKDHTGASGNYITKIYVYDNLGLRSEANVPVQEIINKAPEISNIKVSDVSLSGYTVTFDASDSDGSVAVADVTAYNENRGVGTLVWRHASKIGTKTYQYRVNTKDHTGASGNYITKIYVYDNYGLRSEANVPVQKVENKVPVINNVSITSKTDWSYTIRFTAIDPEDELDIVNVVIYNNVSGESNAKWVRPRLIGANTYEYTVGGSNFNNEFGKYYTKIYAYDKQSNRGEFTDIPMQEIRKKVPVEILNVTVFDVTSNGYTVGFDVKSSITINATNVVAWTNNKGQDDLFWGNPYMYAGRYYYRVNKSDHGNQSDIYESTIYVYGSDGQRYEYTIPSQSLNFSEKYYSQQQSPWGGIYYGNYSMAATGCIPTAVATLLSMYNIQTAPDKVASFLWNNTNEFNKMYPGASGSAIRLAINRYGLTANGISNYQKFLSELRTGRGVAIIVGAGTFTGNGLTHAIVITKISGDMVYVMDPANSSKNGWYSASKVWSQRSTHWYDLRGGFVAYSLSR